MAPPLRSSSLLLFISSLLAVTEGQTRARLALQGRANYNGGWALAIPGSSCPAEAPVACETNEGNVNPNCCPSGQSCFGLLNPHCCPTTADCQNVVANLPVCANSTWNMYELDLSSQEFFCCEPGQYGVLPISGYTGICEPNDQPVASSLIATAASQIGGAAVTGNPAPAAPTTSTLTSTLDGGAVTTIRTTVAGTATQTQTSGASSTGGSASSSVKAAAKKLGLSVGAIVGIAVGALVLILIALVSYYICRRKRSTRYEGGAPSQGPAVYSAVPQPYQGQGPGLEPPEYKSPVTAYAAPAQAYGGNQSHAVSPLSPQPQTGYGGSPPPPQGYGPSQPPPVEAPQRWDGRVEMG